MRYGTTESPNYPYGDRDRDYRNSAGYASSAYGAGGPSASSYEDDDDWDDRAEDFAKDNKMPLALIGVGLGWLLLAGATHTQSYEHARHWADERTSGMRGRVSSRSQGAMSRLREGARHLREQAGSYYGDAKDQVSGGSSDDSPTGRYYDRIADYDSRQEAGYGGSSGGGRYEQVTDRARGMMSNTGQRARQVNGSFWNMVEEHPLAAGLMGLALGAAIGASLPSTEVEDEWLGEYSDQAMDQAWSQGRDAVGRAGTVAKEAAQAGIEAARNTADREAHNQGIHPDDVAEKSDSNAKA